MSSSARGGSRALTNALNNAGIRRGGGDERMEIDSGIGRAGGRHKRTGARSAGPLDQTGRRSKETPYDKPNGKTLSSRITGLNGSPGGASSSKKKGGRDVTDPRRAPQGASEVRKNAQTRQRQHNNINAILKGDEIKQWLRNRMTKPGYLDFSNLNNDPWLTAQGVIPPGHKEAPPNTGQVFWRLAQSLETPEQRIHTLILDNNGFTNLSQLSSLPRRLPYIRALSLADNPINHVDELKHLQSHSEAQGKAGAAAGSLKSLTELRLNGCRFREKMLEQPGGNDRYTHKVLARFPGLLLLDGVLLNRIVFPLQRQPAVRRTEDERKQLASARPFTYPLDIQPTFQEAPACMEEVIRFCTRFFPLWDQNRSEAVYAYHPEATISISANVLPSRSFQAKEVAGKSRPPPVSFERWLKLPGRNFFQGCKTAAERKKSLKSPMDIEGLLQWVNNQVPETEHNIADGAKWCFDTWFLGNNERICAVIQGEFKQKPSNTYRSFTRTFILTSPPEASPPAAKGWPCCILSDTMVVHSYLGSGSFDKNVTLARGDISILPAGPPVAITAPTPNPPEQAALIAQVSQITGMNATFSELCLAQNEWNVEHAVKNFEQIRQTIPPEAFV